MAALRLVGFQLARSTRRRVRTLTGLSAFLTLELVLAVTTSPWFWLAVAAFGGGLALAIDEPRRLRARFAELRAGSKSGR